jgi:hypothetical protein
MIPEGILIALSAGGSAIFVALAQSLPQIKTRRDIKKILSSVDNLEKYVIPNQDKEKVRQKFTDIQCYYTSKVDESIKYVAIMKSDSFIKLVVDFGLSLDLENVNHFTVFQDHLKSASIYNERRMLELIGPELTNKFYAQNTPNILRYSSIVQKIFFTTENSKKTKFITASIDFMQIFMTELVCLTNGYDEKHLLDDYEMKTRRLDDHLKIKI